MKQQEEQKDEQKDVESLTAATENIKIAGEKLKPTIEEAKETMQQLVESAPPEHQAKIQAIKNESIQIIAQLQAKKITQSEAIKQLNALR